MESRLKVLGHPLHPILIVFPLGLFITSFVFDVIRFISGNVFFAEVAFWMISAGLIGGLLAGAAGLVDYVAIPRGTRAAKIAQYHAIGNLFVLTAFAVGWAVRLYAQPHGEISLFSFLCSVLGVLLGGMTAWLGGELVDRLGIGVDNGANANASSSLSGRPASEKSSIAERELSA